MMTASQFVKRFQKPSHCKVLVCGFDPASRDALDRDGGVYSRHYPSVNVAVYSTISDLLDAVRNGYDIVHLFCPLAPGGWIVDAHGKKLAGSELIQKCCDSDVKLLWVANANQPEDYVNGFKAKGKPLNVIMTINRNGDGFGEFLEKLLDRIAKGETLPRAWTGLVPQREGSWQQNLPGCIFFAGRGNVQFLP